MSPQDFGLTLALFPSPPSTVPPSPRNSNNTESNKSMALGSTTPAPSSSRPELALYYFNSPTMLPHQKKPIPLMPSNTSNVDVMMVPEEDGKGPTAEPAPRKRERSPLPPDSEKGNKRQTPRKMRSSPFLAAATGHFFQAARSLQLSPSSLSAAVTAPATSPKAADSTTTGVRNGDTALRTTTLNASNSNSNVNSAEMESVKVISRAVRQRVAQSSSSSTAASAIAVDTAASVRSVEVECTSPTASAPIPPAPSSSSSKSPFKKRRRVERTQRPSSPLRNPPLSASDFPIASSSTAAPSTTAPAKAKKPVKSKPTAWEKRPLLQKVILKEFERTPHGAEILRRGAKAGIAYLEEQRRLLEATGRENQSPKSGRKSTSSDEYEAEGVIVKSRSKEVSSMRHWGRIVKTALAGPLKEMAGPMAGDGRPPMPMIRAW